MTPAALNTLGAIASIAEVILIDIDPLLMASGVTDEVSTVPGIVNSPLE